MSQRRSQNFSEAEAVLLESLVSKYKNVIENKRTDAVSNTDKERCWNTLTEEFNTNCPSPHVTRDTKCLKAKHLNIKKSAKKKSANNKMNLYKTGGGQFNTSEFTPSEEVVLTTIGPSVEGLPPRYDDFVLDYQSDSSKSMELEFDQDEVHTSSQREINMPNIEITKVAVPRSSTSREYVDFENNSGHLAKIIPSDRPSTSREYVDFENNSGHLAKIIPSDRPSTSREYVDFENNSGHLAKIIPSDRPSTSREYVDFENNSGHLAKIIPSDRPSTSREYVDFENNSGHLAKIIPSDRPSTSREYVDFENNSGHLAKIIPSDRPSTSREYVDFENNSGHLAKIIPSDRPSTSREYVDFENNSGHLAKIIPSDRPSTSREYVDFENNSGHLAKIIPSDRPSTSREYVDFENNSGHLAKSTPSARPCIPRDCLKVEKNTSLFTGGKQPFSKFNVMELKTPKRRELRTSTTLNNLNKTMDTKNILKSEAREEQKVEHNLRCKVLRLDLRIKRLKLKLLKKKISEGL